MGWSQWIQLHSRTAVPPIWSGTAVRNTKVGLFRTVSEFCSEQKYFSVPNTVFRTFDPYCSEHSFVGFCSEQLFGTNTNNCSEQLFGTNTDNCSEQLFPKNFKLVLLKDCFVILRQFKKLTKLWELYFKAVYTVLMYNIFGFLLSLTKQFSILPPLQFVIIY